MAILRKTNKQRYTTFLHSISLDENLSLKDFGLLIKLLSLPDDWKFSEKGLEKILKKDGQTSIRTAVKNLEKYGYLRRERVREKNGQVSDVVWYIYEEPQIGNPPEEPENTEKEPDFENHNLDVCDIKNPDCENHNWESRKQYNINKYNINIKKSKEETHTFPKKENSQPYNNHTNDDCTTSFSKCQDPKKNKEKVYNLTDRKKSFNEIIENFCAGNSELEEKLKEFVQMRFRMKKCLTNSSLKELLDELVKVSGGNKELMIEIVKKSLRNSWADFYKPNTLKQEPEKTPSPSRSYDVEEYENYSLFDDLYNAV